MTLTFRQVIRIAVRARELGPWGDCLILCIGLGFLGFFRQSNMLPKSAKAFDPTRHLCRKDVKVVTGGLQVRIRWTKTEQVSSDRQVLVPRLDDYPEACPVRAYQRMLQHSPTWYHDQPLFSFRERRLKTVTLSVVKAAFKGLLEATGHNAASFTLHSLRRSGATHAHSKGVPIDYIRFQGFWKSDAMFRYVRPSTAHANPLVTAMTRP